MISLHLVLQTVLHIVSIQGKLTVVDLLGTPFWYALFGCFERGFHFIAQSGLKSLSLFELHLCAITPSFEYF